MMVHPIADCFGLIPSQFVSAHGKPAGQTHVLRPDVMAADRPVSVGAGCAAKRFRDIY
jgi:hypothetical protein